jgi:hypothetical protein
MKKSRVWKLGNWEKRMKQRVWKMERTELRNE